MSRPVLLIAGGSRGIGAATAKLAGERGYDVAVNYKTNSNAAAAVVKSVEKAGGKAVSIQGDMALENDIERVFDDVGKKLGTITHFVHSSGIIGDNSRLDEASAQTIREVLDIDTFGALLCLRACVRRMSNVCGMRLPKPVWIRW
jgi:NAD(P)-dependent dehydrogenase (short-subunit alcohol dehydrogenase family)